MLFLLFLREILGGSRPLNTTIGPMVEETTPDIFNILTGIFNDDCVTDNITQSLKHISILTFEVYSLRLLVCRMLFVVGVICFINLLLVVISNQRRFWSFIWGNRYNLANQEDQNIVNQTYV